MNQSLISWVFILIYLTCYISNIKFFLYLNIFRVVSFLHICLIVVGLKFHLVLVTSAHYCWSITHLLVSVHQLIITLNLCFLKIIFSQTTSEISNVENNNRFSLKIFYGSKTVFETIKSDKQKCIKIVTVLNQSVLIILFAEVFVRIFCRPFHLVSLDFFVSPWTNCKRYF